MAEVVFRYSVSVEDEDIVLKDGRWVMSDNAKEAAYEVLMEGISDRSGDWYPRYEVACGEEFMAGQVCELEKGHEGGHQ